MKQRSIFFPLVLIAAGSIWLLVSMGRIPFENIWALAHFWPFMLIAAGIGLILRSYWAPMRILMELLVVGGAVAAIVFAPQLGWNTPQWGFGFGYSFGGGASGSGKIVSEMRQLQGVTGISIEYPADVLIQQGSAESVKIEADDNLVPQISNTVKNGTLVIRNNVNWAQRVNPTKKVKITITVKDLNSIDLSGAGTVRVEKLNTQALSVDVSGAGDLTINQLNATSIDCDLSGAGSIALNGTTGKLKLAISGVGDFDGSKLLSKTVTAEISGTGSASVHASDTLDAQISGTGSIDYYGSPSVSKHVSGLGSVTKIGE